MFGKLVSLLVVVTLSISCGRPMEEHTSYLDIIGGVVISNSEHPGSISYDPGNGSLCSGTFVSSTTMISAAHCVSHFGDSPNPDPSLIRVINGPQRRAIKAINNPNNPLTFPDDELENHDLAVVIFPNGTTKKFNFITQRAPRVGDNLVLIGFGPSSLDGQNDRKRKGNTKITSFDRNGGINVRIRNNEGAVSAPGDSGGTVLRQNKLIGAMVGGDGSSSFIANITSPENISFLRSVVKNQGATICGLDGACK